MTQRFTTLKDWMTVRESLEGKLLGFVPTMGALHVGHKSLFERSLAENEKTLVSIFVNPTQFNNSEDFQKYPQTLTDDLQMLDQLGVDFVLTPTFDELYADSFRYQVQENSFSKDLCGAERTGHFNGVLTVVMKLLNLARADRAYFGEKDFQQLKLVKDMVHTFFMKTEIVACPTVRNSEGLALSSRNLRLSSDDLAKAPKLHSALCSNQSTQTIRETLGKLGFQIEYLKVLDDRLYCAAWLGGVRLIDNVDLKSLGRSERGAEETL